MRFWVRVRQAFDDPDGGTSMTRVVAFMVAVVVCFGLVIVSLKDHFHDVGWPLASIVAVTLLAVPLQALFRALTAWLQSSEGKKLLQQIISKVTAAPLTIEPTEPDSAPGAVTTTTTVNPGESK